MGSPTRDAALREMRRSRGVDLPYLATETFVELDWYFLANDNVPPRDRGPYISTFTGRFWPFDPRPEDVRIEDIAHSLARLARYTGHGKRRYYVAEHSVHICRYLRKRCCTREEILSGLLHDAPEALSGFGDVARPSKRRAPIIAETEDSIYRLAVAPKFSLPLTLPECVHEADVRICADEMSQNMHEVDPSVGSPLGISLEHWSSRRAEKEFLLEFAAVTVLGNLPTCGENRV